jgi:hypothetical protein
MPDLHGGDLPGVIIQARRVGMGNYQETFLFLSWAFNGVMRSFSEGFPVARAKDILSAGRDDGTKGNLPRVRPAAKMALAEHSMVRAVREIHEGDETVPAGATGTIVHVIKGGVGYDVEFTAPKHVVISAGRDELASV